MGAVSGPGASKGRVVAVAGQLVAVSIGTEDHVATLAGRLEARPVVGDNVAVTHDDDSVRVVGIEPRHSSLARVDRLGRRVQVLAANADLLVVVASIVSPPLRRGLIDRLLVAASVGGMQAGLVLTKLDRSGSATTEALRLLDEYRRIGYDGVAIDARTPQGVQAVRGLIAGRLAAVTGHSGVGKSTLVNGLTGGVQTTGAVNEVIGRGRHTTTSARLIRGDDVDIIDLPGIRGFAPAGVTAETLADTFPDIAGAAAHCRFPNCLHVGELGCAVPDAVSAARLDSYRKLLSEIVGSPARN
jgi:ribosome biogenesis GTPase